MFGVRFGPQFTSWFEVCGRQTHLPTALANVASGGQNSSNNQWFTVRVDEFLGSLWAAHLREKRRKYTIDGSQPRLAALRWPLV